VPTSSRVEPQPPRAPLGPKQYSPELEALRGLAILLVFAYHATSMVLGGDHPGQRVSLPAAYVRAGHTGVTLFFVLSAFLLSRPFLAEARGEGRVGRRAFFERRARRIVPLYWVAVLVGVLASASRPGDLWHAAPNLLFLSGLPGVPDLFPYGSVWWSLGTEVQFYLLLPLLPRALRAPRISLAVALVYAALFAALVPSASVWLLGTRGSLAWRAPSFAAGILAAWAYERVAPGLLLRGAPAWLRNGGADALLLLLLGALGALLAWVIFRGYLAAEREQPAWHVLEALLWAGVVLALLLVPLRLRALLVNPPLEWVGRISYSVYLTHLPVLFFVLYPLLAHARPERFDARWLGWTLLALGLCLALSAATYRWIERPFLRRRAPPQRSRGTEDR
jgi:peptidoglycan/LPS O-acetylase OafA/YrhL